MTRVASPAIAPSPASGAQFEIGSGNQQVVVTDVGATLRSYRVDGHDVIDGFSLDDPAVRPHDGSPHGMGGAARKGPQRSLERLRVHRLLDPDAARRLVGVHNSHPRHE